MKKILSAILFAIIFSTVPVQAQSNFDFNGDSKVIFMSNIHNGKVFGVSSYLILRAEPNENSAEIMRIPVGAELILRERYIQGWWEVITVTFDGKTFSNDYAGDGIGWVSAKFVKTY